MSKFTFLLFNSCAIKLIVCPNIYKIYIYIEIKFHNFISILSTKITHLKLKKAQKVTHLSKKVVYHFIIYYTHKCSIERYRILTTTTNTSLLISKINICSTNTLNTFRRSSWRIYEIPIRFCPYSSCDKDNRYRFSTKSW